MRILMTIGSGVNNFFYRDLHLQLPCKYRTFPLILQIFEPPPSNKKEDTVLNPLQPLRKCFVWKHFMNLMIPGSSEFLKIEIGVSI